MYPSADGTTLSITFHSSITALIAQNIDTLDSKKKQDVIKTIISTESQKSPNPSLPPGWYAPETVLVQNANGTSNAIPVIINLAKGL